MRRILDFFLPRLCLSCSEPLPGKVYPLPLCRSCHRRLIAIEAERCRTCCRPLPKPLTQCGACLRSPAAFEHLIAGWSFEPPVAEILRALKFGRLEGLGKPLARAIFPVLDQYLHAHDLAVDVVVPVPLHPTRYLTRGYNQAERIARPLARLLGKPCRLLLRRHRVTRPQARLRRQKREKNLEGVFRRRRGRRIDRQKVLLVDDVVTTGATLRAAAKALRKAGSGPVIAVAIARTPETRRNSDENGNISPLESV